MATNLQEKISDNPETAMKYHGVHHLVLNTDDIKKTIDFYQGVLGMKLIHAMKTPPGVGTGSGNRGNPPYEEIRHYFFDMGNDDLMAFFEIPKGKEPEHHRNAIGAMQHVSFSITADMAPEFMKRLDNNGVEYRGPIEAMPGIFSIYFFDCNDSRLEVTYQSADNSGQPENLKAFTQTKEQALSELTTVTDDKEWLEWATKDLA